MSKTLGILSIKGGVGKTNSAINLSSALAFEFGKKVLLVDANFSAPNVGMNLGLPDPEATLHDVLTSRISLQNAIYEYHKNLHILPGSMLNERMNPFKLREKLHKAKEYYDYIIIDSSPNLNNEILATMLASDELFVVSSPDMPTLSCTMHAIKVAKERKTPISGIILNKVRNRHFELSIDEIEDAAGVPVVAVLPDDVKVLEAVALTKPIVEHKPLNTVSVEFKKLAAAIVNQEYKDPRVWRNVFSLFSRNLKKHEVNRNLLREGKLY